ncbi:MAG: hypothetical protein K2P84_11305, partial [Undibacterium sp.]|nr:hypothetical protein [Undibacterium sp.]
SMISGETGKTIGERVNLITEVVKTTMLAAQNANERDREALRQSGIVVKQVLGHVQGLGDAAELMRNQGTVIRHDVENLLVTLQYQDRVSQMLDVIDRDIAKMLQTFTENHGAPSTAEWLNELETYYTMNDQRGSHAQSRSAAHTSKPEESEITFF